jgi:hypothetical protein
MKTDLSLIRAAFVTRHETFPWRRQLPDGQETVEGVQFFVPVDQADVVFVYDSLPAARLAVPAHALTVFVCSEPSNVKRYDAAFLSQFDVVITSDRKTPHSNRVFVQAGLPWHVGCMTEGGKLLSDPMSFEDFERHDPVKTRLVSVVSSDKAFTEEHRARLAFVAKLKDTLGDQVDVFGRGIADFADKRDVLDAYRYHIALENCSIQDYWTEKIADPYLTLTYPIYHGCPNISDYFNKDAVTQIDIYNPDEAISTIKKIVESDLAERSREALIEARRRLMTEHNVFFMLSNVARNETINRIDKVRIVRLKREVAFLPFCDRWKIYISEFVTERPGLRRFLRRIKVMIVRPSISSK